MNKLKLSITFFAALISFSSAFAQQKQTKPANIKQKTATANKKQAGVKQITIKPAVPAVAPVEATKKEEATLEQKPAGEVAVTTTEVSNTKATSIQANDLKTFLSKQSLKDADVTLALSRIETLIDNRTNFSVKDLLDLCLLYSNHDQSDAPYHLASSLKESNPAEFEKALSQLSKDDAKKIREFVEISQSMGSGNG